MTRRTKSIDAISTKIYACMCGCRSVKLIACDKDDMPFAVISFTAEQWEGELLPEIREACKQVNGEGVTVQ